MASIAHRHSNYVDLHYFVCIICPTGSHTRNKQNLQETSSFERAKFVCRSRPQYNQLHKNFLHHLSTNNSTRTAMVLASSHSLGLGSSSKSEANMLEAHKNSALLSSRRCIGQWFLVAVSLLLALAVPIIVTAAMFRPGTVHGNKVLAECREQWSTLSGNLVFGLDVVGFGLPVAIQLWRISSSRGKGDAK